MMPEISVVVPAFNAGPTITPVLEGLIRAGFASNSITVIDDGSLDDTVARARAFGVKVVGNETSRGAAFARNIGAATTSGDLILFVDADVVVHCDVRDRLLEWHRQNPDEAAIFGSYDKYPSDRRRVSRIRNLLHHHTHQIASRSASTFWTGLGAVRRSNFDAVGGFDPAQKFMEDIAFGHALKKAGSNIRLDRDLQGTHLKHWSLFGFMKTDLLHRAIPWSRLIRSSAAPRDLNAGAAGVASVLCVFLSLVSIVSLAFSVSAGVVLIVVFELLLFWLNRGFLKLLYQLDGPKDCLIGFAVLWLHFLMAGLGFAWVLVSR